MNVIKVTNVFNWYSCFNQDKCFFVVRNCHFKAFFTQTFYGHALLLDNFHYLKGFQTHTNRLFWQQVRMYQCQNLCFTFIPHFHLCQFSTGPACIVFRISSRLWAYLNLRKSFSQYPVDTTTLTPVFRKIWKMYLGYICLRKFYKQLSPKGRLWWGTGFQADEVPAAPHQPQCTIMQMVQEKTVLQMSWTVCISWVCHR